MKSILQMALAFLTVHSPASADPIDKFIKAITTKKETFQCPILGRVELELQDGCDGLIRNRKVTDAGNLVIERIARQYGEVAIRSALNTGYQFVNVKAMEDIELEETEVSDDASGADVAVEDLGSSDEGFLQSLIKVTHLQGLSLLNTSFRTDEDKTNRAFLNTKVYQVNTRLGFVAEARKKSGEDEIHNYPNVSSEFRIALYPLAGNKCQVRIANSGNCGNSSEELVERVAVALDSDHSNIYVPVKVLRHKGSVQAHLEQGKVVGYSVSPLQRDTTLTEAEKRAQAQADSKKMNEMPAGRR